MVRLLWDQIGQRLYETGVDRGVLYLPNVSGVYDNGYTWNGLTTITESPSGAESNPQYADNIKYIDILSAEEFGGTIEALTYPEEFAQCDGTALVNNIGVGQQSRKSFGLSYRTLLGNDVLGTAYGYKIHIVYGATAAPSEKANATINDSPEPVGFSWEFSTTPAPIGNVGGTDYKPTASLTIDSTKVSASNLQALEDLLYGTAGTNPSLPTPAAVIALFAGALTGVDLSVSTNQPTYVAGTHVVTLPSVTGIQWSINGVNKTPGAQPALTVGQVAYIKATPLSTYRISAGTDDWAYAY